MGMEVGNKQETYLLFPFTPHPYLPDFLHKPGEKVLMFPTMALMLHKQWSRSELYASFCTFYPSCLISHPLYIAGHIGSHFVWFSLIFVPYTLAISWGQGVAFPVWLMTALPLLGCHSPEHPYSPSGPLCVFVSAVQRPRAPSFSLALTPTTLALTFLHNFSLVHFLLGVFSSLPVCFGSSHRHLLFALPGSGSCFSVSTLMFYFWGTANPPREAVWTRWCVCKMMWSL